jgi:hypothetical protein
MIPSGSDWFQFVTEVPLLQTIVFLTVGSYHNLKQWNPKCNQQMTNMSPPMEKCKRVTE